MKDRRELRNILLPLALDRQIEESIEAQAADAEQLL
jgi:hypothetical protein